MRQGGFGAGDQLAAVGVDRAKEVDLEVKAREGNSGPSSFARLTEWELAYLRPLP